MNIDRSHDPSRGTWISGKPHKKSGFPIQNLPLGVFREPGGVSKGSIGIRILDQVLDLKGLAETGLLDSLSGDVQDAFVGSQLNGWLALSRTERKAARLHISDLLSTEVDADKRGKIVGHLQHIDEIEMVLPVEVGDYTDFYGSIDHAQRVGSLFRPDNPLLPNYRWVPIGYHGRASSLVVDGTPIQRPSGQRLVGDTPSFEPTSRLDYELEIGAWIGPGNDMGEPIPLEEVEEHFAGISLVNDWSARDIQSWEAQPLGPFLGKSFATSVSPWLVTAEALVPFRCPSHVRGPGEPEPLPYLLSDKNRQTGGIDAVLEVWIQTSKMRDQSLPHHLLSSARLADLYWTLGQMITHHSSNGCPLRAGDLVGTGTVSGKDPASAGCLLELTTGGENPVRLPSGEIREFLEGGDQVVLRGHLRGSGDFQSIGLGEVKGIVVDG
jgi:fumarylacetoacetase